MNDALISPKLGLTDQVEGCNSRCRCRRWVRDGVQQCASSNSLPICSPESGHFDSDVVLQGGVLTK